MRHRVFGLLLACLILGAEAPAARAGMPAPLPEKPPELILRLNQTPLMRLQAISFFLAGLLLCAAAVQWLWNYFRKDFPRLPRLSFGKALAGVLLWGLLFIIVLAMISGARELMTPGAWKKQGFTYQLADRGEPASEAAPEKLRRQGLERLRTALWQFAATHNGRFPSGAEKARIASRFWEVPESGGMSFLYVQGLSAGRPGSPLAYEPELEADQRLVLLTDGKIVTLRSAEITRLLERKGKP